MIDRISKAKTMQLATANGGQPWVCTVYFVLHKGSFYWLSEPGRRHSKELADNVKAAIAIVLKTDVPVMGVQAEGDVLAVNDPDAAKPVLEEYIAKYGQGKQFIERLRTGKNQHVLYRFTPRTAMMFDEYGHSDSPYFETSLK